MKSKFMKEEDDTFSRRKLRAVVLSGDASRT